MKLPETDTHFRDMKEVNGYQRGALFHALAFVTQWRVAIDVGAHVGYISKDIGPLFRRVYAFEPNYENFKCLRENVGSNVECCNWALGSEHKRMGMATPMVANSGAWQVVEGVSIEVRPLDEFEYVNCDFMKIDVQGMELDVLMGAKKTISTHHPVMLVETTMDGVENKDIFKWFRDMDYDFCVKTGKNTVFVWQLASLVGT